MLGVRLDPQLDRMLSAEARRRGTTKSKLARDAIRAYLEGGDLIVRAREQSLRASQLDPPASALDFDHDDRGWTD